MPRPVVMTSRAAPRPRSGSDTGSLARLARQLRALTPDDPGLYTVTDLSDRRAASGSRSGRRDTTASQSSRDGGTTGSRFERRGTTAAQLDRRGAATGSWSGLAAGWIPVTEALPAMVACAGEHLSFSPAVAGARMIGSLGYAVAGRVSVALAVTGRAYDAGPDSLAVRLDDAGLIEQVGIRNPVLAVAAAQNPDELPDELRLADLSDVIAWAADRAWATLDPRIDELHELTRYGRVPMWNLVADSVLGPATVAPRRAGLDQQAGRAIGSAFLDALVERGAPIHRRGTLRATSAPPGSPSTPSAVEPPVPANGLDLPSTPDAAQTLELTPVRGSCCLYFRQTQEKCASCPLLTSNAL